MGRRSPQSVLQRAREQALREKRGLKQAKKVVAVVGTGVRVG